jgi:hypothetical protein
MDFGKPDLADYVQLMYTLFDKYEQAEQVKQGKKPGKPFTYEQKSMLVFFAIMQFRRIFQFKAQHRWLERHEAMWPLLDWKQVPHRTTLSRRYKALYTPIQDFVDFVKRFANELDERFSHKHLVEDKSLFKALGPVWHQKDRQAGRIPEKLRNLDTEATWSKSGYHGWVYGYGLHITCNAHAFPALVQVETASVSESEVIDQKASQIMDMEPETVATDNSYTKATRIRQWAKQGVILLTPAHQWKNGRYATAYHRFIKQPHITDLIRSRRTSVEPFFDLLARILGLNGPQKQLPTQGLANVRTCLSLATLTIQIAMIANSIWNLPLRNIATITAAFT